LDKGPDIQTFKIEFNDETWRNIKAKVILDLESKFINFDNRKKKFIGRCSSIWRISRILSQGDNVNLYEYSGIGKTELAKEIGYFLYEKNKFPNGILYFNLDESDARNQIESKIEKEKLLKENQNVNF